MNLASDRPGGGLVKVMRAIIVLLADGSEATEAADIAQAIMLAKN
jgi:hypothetical protein